MSTTASFFRNRFVQAIMLSGLFLQIGIWVRNFAVLLYVIEMTNNDAMAVSMIYVAEFAPIFLFSFIGGTFADRWRPKRTMIWCDLLSAVSVFVVLATLVYGNWHVIFFATLVSAILSQFSQPSGMKLFKLHVPGEQLQMGMAMFQSMMALFMIIGPAIGTWVFQSFGVEVSIAIMGFAFLISAAVLTLLPPDPEQTEEKPSTTLMEEMKAGFSYVGSKPALKILCYCFASAGAALGIIQPLGVFVVTERLGLTADHLQWFLMANGAAMIVGGGLAMAVSKKVPPHIMLTIGMLATTISLPIIGFSTNLVLTLAAQFFSGLFLPMVHIGINTIMLQTSEESFIGRVNGILTPLFMGSMVILMGASGWLKENFLTVPVMYNMAAVIFMIGILLILPLYKMGFTASKPEEKAAEPMMH